MSENTYTGPDRRSGGRRADDELAGNVDALLYGRICSAHEEAERAYFRALDRTGPLFSLVAAKNGKAEGLAEAVALLAGSDVVEVRAKVAKRLEDERDRNLAGVDRARAAIR